MSEITYDALRKRLAAVEAENAKLQEAIEMARQCIDADDVIGAHAILIKTMGEKK